jgi:hypothetical protein
MGEDVEAVLGRGEVHAGVPGDVGDDAVAGDVVEVDVDIVGGGVLLVDLEQDGKQVLDGMLEKELEAPGTNSGRSKRRAQEQVRAYLEAGHARSWEREGLALAMELPRVHHSISRSGHDWQREQWLPDTKWIGAPHLRSCVGVGRFCERVEEGGCCCLLWQSLQLGEGFMWEPGSLDAGRSTSSRRDHPATDLLG